MILFTKALTVGTNTYKSTSVIKIITTAKITYLKYGRLTAFLTCFLTVLFTLFCDILPDLLEFFFLSAIIQPLLPPLLSITPRLTLLSLRGPYFDILVPQALLLRRFQ